MNRQQRRHSKAPSLIPIAVGWYTEQEWAKVKAASVDPERFESTYAEWVQMANEAVASLSVCGHNVQRSPIIAEELLAWCIARGKVNDAAARAAFVSEAPSRVSKRSA